MKALYLCLTLKSDATFGRGDGVAGLVDIEVEHDEYGLPFLRGRALKGLLVEECANILYALNSTDNDVWRKAAKFLFGQPGSRIEDDGEMFVGDARLPDELRKAVIYEVETGQQKLKDGKARREEIIQPDDVLESLTAIRRQTAMTVRGAPRRGSLRSMRVVLRETTFESELTFYKELGAQALALLTACAVGLRRVGTGRNRGRGLVAARLYQKDDAAQAKDITLERYKEFTTAATEEA